MRPPFPADCPTSPRVVAVCLQFCQFGMYMCIAMIKLRQELRPRLGESSLVDVLAVTSVEQIAGVLVALILLALVPVIVLVLLQARLATRTHHAYACTCLSLFP